MAAGTKVLEGSCFLPCPNVASYLTACLVDCWCNLQIDRWCSGLLENARALLERGETAGRRLSVFMHENVRGSSADSVVNRAGATCGVALRIDRRP